MKILDWCGILFVFVLGCVAADAKSLLVPMEMPKTISDVSFVDRMENEIDGYEPYAGLTAYQKLQFVEMESVAHDAIDQELIESGICFDEGCPITKDVESIPVYPDTTGVSIDDAGMYCAKRNSNIAENQKIPFGLPVNSDDMKGVSLSANAKKQIKNTNDGLMGSTYGCRCQYMKSKGTWLTRPHKGVDVWVHKDFYQAPIYTAADGVVEFVIFKKDEKQKDSKTGQEKVVTKWYKKFLKDGKIKVKELKKFQSSGNYIRIVHNDGWVTQYMHLDKIFVEPGQLVSAGCQIALMGHTGGRAYTGQGMGVDLTHLHYEIEYKGLQTAVTAPNGTNINIVRGPECEYRNSTFGNKICPNQMMVWDKTLPSDIANCTWGQEAVNKECAKRRNGS